MRFISGLLVLCVGSSAFAALTTIQPTPHVNSELSLLANAPNSNVNLQGGGAPVLAQLAAAWNSSFVRIDDSLDQLWSDVGAQGGQVALTAIYAGANQVLGYRDGASGGAFNLIHNFNSNDGLVFNPSSWKFFDPSDTFRWVRADNNAGSTNAVSSRSTDNGGKDQMVSFLISGGQFNGYRLIAFEDRVNGDYDFNDLVVLVNPGVSIVPVPAAALLGLIGAGVTAAVRRRVA